MSSNVNYLYPGKSILHIPVKTMDLLSSQQLLVPVVYLLQQGVPGISAR